MLSRLILFLVAAIAIVVTGCKPNLDRVGSVDSKTGMKYDQSEIDKFKLKYTGQPTAHGLVFIEGGTLIMGGAEKDIAYEMNNRERQVTIPSFYIDETEISNINYKIFWNKMRNDSGEFKFQKLYPDTTVWYRSLAYNDPYIRYYHQHPAFNQYPVVGVSWYQANEYCKWRTQIVNDDLKTKTKNLNQFVEYPYFRLPTEGEWEYAARGLLEQELYPWEGKSLRQAKGGFNGRFRANFKRGRGDYAGRSDKGGSRLIEGLNDGHVYPAPLKFYPANDFGLYDMAGNVAEWTMDTYRVLSFEDNEDVAPYRRRGNTSAFNEKYGDYLLDDVNYSNGKSPSRQSLLLNTSRDLEPVQDKSPRTIAGDPRHPEEFNPGPQPDYMHDRVKVYRGGSWQDVAYYQSCGTRRFYNADSSAAHIGFRCAMTRLGSPKLQP